MEVVFDNVLAVTSKTQWKRIKEIKRDVIALLMPDDELLLLDDDTRLRVEKQVEDLIKEDKKRDKQSMLEYKNGKYKQKKTQGGGLKPAQNTSYIGTAGELAVMSELLFRGYNVNRMIIDEGIDLIATKNNIYYYIQVKTTSVDVNGKIHVSIDLNRFSQYAHHATQLRYMIVARYNDKGIDRNKFYTFTADDISKGIHGKYIKQGINSVSIKIRICPQSGSPYLYDDKESDISWHENKFTL